MREYTRDKTKNDFWGNDSYLISFENRFERYVKWYNILGGSKKIELYDSIQSIKKWRQNHDNISYCPQELA